MVQSLELKQGETLSLAIRTELDLSGYELVSLLHDTDDTAEGLAYDLQPELVINPLTGLPGMIMLKLGADISLSLLPSSNRYVFDVGMRSADASASLFTQPLPIRIVQTYSRFA